MAELHAWKRSGKTYMIKSLYRTIDGNKVYAHYTTKERIPWDKNDEYVGIVKYQIAHCWYDEQQREHSGLARAQNEAGEWIYFTEQGINKVDRPNYMGLIKLTTIVSLDHGNVRMHP